MTSHIDRDIHRRDGDMLTDFLHVYRNKNCSTFICEQKC